MVLKIEIAHKPHGLWAIENKKEEVIDINELAKLSQELMEKYQNGEMTREEVVEAITQYIEQQKKKRKMKGK